MKFILKNPFDESIDKKPENPKTWKDKTFSEIMEDFKKAWEIGSNRPEEPVSNSDEEMVENFKKYMENKNNIQKYINYVKQGK